jgi:hypothetical protein
MVLNLQGSKRKVRCPWPVLIPERLANVRRLNARERRTIGPPHVGCYAIANCCIGHDRRPWEEWALDNRFAGYRVLA